MLNFRFQIGARSTSAIFGKPEFCLACNYVRFFGELYKTMNRYRSQEVLHINQVFYAARHLIPEMP